MRRYSQFRSMPATWKMHDKAPVQHLTITDRENPFSDNATVIIHVHPVTPSHLSVITERVPEKEEELAACDVLLCQRPVIRAYP